MIPKRDSDDDVSYEMIDALFKYNWGKLVGDAFPSGEEYLAKLCLSLLSNPFYFANFEKNVVKFNEKSADSPDFLLACPRNYLKFLSQSHKFVLRSLFRDKKVRKISNVRLRKLFDSMDNIWLFEVGLYKLIVLLTLGTSLERIGINRQDILYADEVVSVSRDVDFEAEDD